MCHCAPNLINDGDYPNRRTKISTDEKKALTSGNRLPLVETGVIKKILILIFYLISDFKLVTSLLGQMRESHQLLLQCNGLYAFGGWVG